MKSSAYDQIILQFETIFHKEIFHICSKLIILKSISFFITDILAAWTGVWYLMKCAMPKHVTVFLRLGKVRVCG